MIVRLLAAIALAVATAGHALAHHGLMLWDEETVVVIEGFVAEELDGFPHWEIEVRADDGRDWTVDLGSDFEMGRAGLDADGSDLQIGTEITVEGHLPLDSETLLIRPIRISTEQKVFEFQGAWN